MTFSALINTKGPFDGQDKRQESIYVSYPVTIKCLMRQHDRIN
jgi:hypothetical protein